MGDVHDFVTYERELAIPEVYPDQQCFLCFQAVNYGCEISFQEKKIAEHHGAQLPFEVRLPDKSGGLKGLLQVKAYHRRHYHDGKTCRLPVGFDFPTGSEEWYQWAGQTCFSYGIVGDVDLLILPGLAMRDIFVRSKKQNAAIELFIHVSNRTSSAKNIVLEAAFTGPLAANRYPTSIRIEQYIEGNSERWMSSGGIPWPAGAESYWWPNYPYAEDYRATLHFADIALHGGDPGAAPVHQLRHRFGIVQHEEGPHSYRINGVDYTTLADSISYGQVAGWDSFQHPAFTSECSASWRRYQRIGFNGVRLHVSTPTRKMLEAADEAGFLLIPEAGIWGNRTHHFHPEHTIHAVRSLISHCRAHPSVARYSLTNEVREPVDEHFPWRALIDEAVKCDPSRPLVYELHNAPAGRIPGIQCDKKARIMQHYASLHEHDAAFKGMGEHFWSADGMLDFALGAMRLRKGGWCHIAPWSWVNYWPNFLPGTCRAKHGWKNDLGPDREEGINGWHSPIVEFVQEALHPYLLLDPLALDLNPAAYRRAGDGDLDWPYFPCWWTPGETISLVVFNNGFVPAGFAVCLQAIDREKRPHGDQEVYTLGPIAPNQHKQCHFLPRLTSGPACGSVLQWEATVLRNGEPVFRTRRLMRRFSPRPLEPAITVLAPDLTTRGNWLNKRGFLATYTPRPGNTDVVKNFGVVSLSGGIKEAKVKVESLATEHPDALAYFGNPPKPTDRIASCWMADQKLDFTINLPRQPLVISFYFSPQNHLEDQCMELISESGNRITQQMPLLDQGKYLRFQVIGSVDCSVKSAGNAPAFLNGIFVDVAES